MPLLISKRPGGSRTAGGPAGCLPHPARLPGLALLLLLLMLLAAPAVAAPEAPRICFTPGSDCTAIVVSTIGHARRQILVQAYSFTSAPIAKALVEARKRGVRIKVILDKSQRHEKYSSADFLAHAGIPVLIDQAHAIAHNKIIIVDGRLVLTGSFNFTKAAQERNAENLLLLEGAPLAARYAANWAAHARHSQPYSGRGVLPARQTGPAPGKRGVSGRAGLVRPAGGSAGRSAGHSCTIGKACGRTCIPQDKVCHQ